ncbi:dihydrolipoamide acetyltransferase component of pyruvate dehydrogenase complex [Spirochaetia bacterium]|nr:dihydrolipoamide acetyltransferase component of pyruvate dehydrogenase complex [Spirochaetia bacterium]
MAHVLIMPRQGNTVESCIIQEWKVKEGDSVKADTTVCVVETDKATFEVSAGADGQVLKVLHPDGDDVPVLAPIAVIGAAGEDYSAVLEEEGTPLSDVTSVPNQKPAVIAKPASPVYSGSESGSESGSQAGGGQADGSVSCSPRARNLAAREGIRPAGIAGTGPGGRIIERDVAAALAERPPLTAAALAAAAAGAVVPGAGTGLGGRVTAADLAAGAGAGAGAVGSGRSGGTIPAADTVSSGEGAITETPVKGIRKLIADRMLGSLAESAQFTLNSSAPAARLQELRKRMKAGAEKTNSRQPDGLDLGLAKITVNDLILYAVSRVLPVYPYMNALKIGDILKTYERVHLGMAVDTPRGLMVPVIRNANLLSLRQISAEAKRLAAACQGGSVKPEELSGSTFTVSNLGSFGVTGFTPVLNAPEVAILGVCGIELKPVENDECMLDDRHGCRFEPYIGFSLTINHQVVDGAPAARFLKALCQTVADIDLLLAAN